MDAESEAKNGEHLIIPIAKPAHKALREAMEVVRRRKLRTSCSTIEALLCFMIDTRADLMGHIDTRMTRKVYPYQTRSFY
ncbi:MAG: hypothetical protein E3K36_16410 [Candidatus Brocadia sp.]|nr:hypothetical protein [Candidatus Brocadia sp.]